MEGHPLATLNIWLFDLTKKKIWLYTIISLILTPIIWTPPCLWWSRQWVCTWRWVQASALSNQSSTPLMDSSLFHSRSPSHWKKDILQNKEYMQCSPTSIYQPQGQSASHLIRSFQERWIWPLNFSPWTAWRPSARTHPCCRSWQASLDSFRNHRACICR